MRKLKSASLLLLLALTLNGCLSSGGSSTDVSITPTPTPTPVHTPTMPVEFLKAFGSDPTKADTDEDGLLDEFEIKHGYPFTKPDLKDTDGNGTTDDNEDLDKDGLTQVQEQGYKTDPLNTDSDSDDLSDYDEIVTHKTNPLSNDTDGDGMFDGREIANKTNPLVADADKVITSSNTATVIDPNTKKELKVSVSLTGVGDLSESLEVKIGSNILTTGQVGQQYNVYFVDSEPSKVQSTIITLPFNPIDTSITDVSNLVVAKVNQSTGLWELLPSTIDFANNTITATSNSKITAAFAKNTVIKKAANLSNALKTANTYVVLLKEKHDEAIRAIKQTCDAVSDPSAMPADVALVIDSSGSMWSNDPQNIRLSAAKTFINSMKSTDQVSIIDFDHTSRLALGMSNDKTALSSAVDTIDSDGGTNIGAGITTALQQFQGRDKTKIRAILLLTDGDGEYDSSLTAQLKTEGIRVFTIGLSGSVNTELLNSIANETGGKYKQISDPNGLTGIFKEFASVFGDDGTDTDQDGLTDCQEVQGIFNTRTTQRITTDPYLYDSDLDGLSDGFEVGEPKKTRIEIGVDNGGYPVEIIPWMVTVFSDPNSKDTDEDELADADELEFGTSPTDPDTDGDKITDFSELNDVGTLPTERDTDGDSLDDAEEVFNQSKGYDPLVQNIIKNTTWNQEYWEGFRGTNPDFTSLAQVYGSISGSVLIIGDISTFYNQVNREEYWEAVVTFVALLPIAGDTVKAVNVSYEYIKLKPSAFASFITNLPAPEILKTKIIQKTLPLTVQNIKLKGRWILPAYEGAKRPVIHYLERGRVMETLYGNTRMESRFTGLFDKFPKIDAFDYSKLEALSFKTLDFTQPSYANKPSNIRGMLKFYADDLLSSLDNYSSLRGKNVYGIPVEPIKKIDFYRMDIAFPDVPTKEIQDILDKLKADYAGKVEINYIYDLF